MKLLFITYYWPPAGGVSAQRIIHFVKNLSNLGVECHVIHPQNPTYYQEDQSLGQLIPEAVVLHPVGIKDITSLVKKVPNMNTEGNIKSNSGGLLNNLSKWLRANLFIPDPKVNWVKPVVKVASQLIQNENYDLIFTNGTPHSVHLAGLALKKKFGLPWIADFRDPWTKIDYFEKMPLTKRSLNKHTSLEAKVVHAADICLTVSPSWREDFDSLGAKQTFCITNGYEEPIQKIEEIDFIISHVGSLHGDRSLDELLIAFDLIVKKEETGQAKTKLALVGNINQTTLEQIKDNVSPDRLLLPGILSHQKAKEWIARSSVLLLPINQSKDAQGRIPAKLFEYLASQIPIVVLGSKNGDAAKIVTETKAGKCFEQDEYKALYEYISELKSKRDTANPQINDVSRYSRENTAKQLYTLIKSLI